MKCNNNFQPDKKKRRIIYRLILYLKQNCIGISLSICLLHIFINMLYYKHDNNKINKE